MCSWIIETYHNELNIILYCGVNSHPLQNTETINKKLFVLNKIVNPFE